MVACHDVEIGAIEDFRLAKKIEGSIQWLVHERVDWEK